MRKSTQLLTATLALAGVAAYLLMDGGESASHRQHTAAPEQAAAAVEHSTSAAAPAPIETVFQATGSLTSLQQDAPFALQGLEPPELLWDEDGQLLADFSSRDWLEFFRSVPYEQQQQAMSYRETLLQQLEPSQRAQLEQLAADYQNLLRAEFDLRESYSDMGIDEEISLAMQGRGDNDAAWSKAKEMVAKMQQLRREMLGEPLAEAWFEDDNAVENYTIAALEIARSPNLSESQKAQKVAQLDVLLPQHMVQSIQLSRQSSALAEEVSQWQTAGWSESQIEHALQDKYGDDFAKRWRNAAIY